MQPVGRPLADGQKPLATEGTEATEQQVVLMRRKEIVIQGGH